MKSADFRNLQGQGWPSGFLHLVVAKKYVNDGYSGQNTAFKVKIPGFVMSFDKTG